MNSHNKTVVLGVTGSIAAYKAADIASQLVKNDIKVYVIMTKNAEEFINPLTFQSITSNPVIGSMFQNIVSLEIEHITLAKKADLFIVAPASANMIGKLANGIADDMLSTTIMATKAKVLIAPAMNSAMYENFIVQENMHKLLKCGYYFVEPQEGRLACGDIGIGKLAETNVIIDKAICLLETRQDLEGKTILVTAGPTRERIDPVRYISNDSSGKMGYEIAIAARNRGGKVTLISGPTSLTIPTDIHFISVMNTEEMYRTVMNHFDISDIVIKAAAPADFKIKEFYAKKLKKDDLNQHGLCLAFENTTDILAKLGKLKTKQILVGFAAETDHLVDYATKKIQQKNLDIIIANDVTQEGAGFNSDTNIITIIDKKGKTTKLPKMSKQDVAHKIIDVIMEYML